MKTLIRFAVLLTLSLLLRAYAAETFSNPILPGFYPDPSICRVGDDYFLVNSTFEYFPGVPIFQSKDLVHWQQIGDVLTRKSQLNLDKMYSSGGIFAPVLRWHDGIFYMITTVVGSGGSRGGNFFVTATNAAGPWSDPVWLDRDGIDPSLFFDTDGKVYFTRQVDGEHGYSGQQLLNLQTGKFEGERKELWRGTGGVWPEGPHLYHINGKYYLMISEGGTSYNHSLTVARSDSPWGPFEANPANPILTHRNLPENPFQATGHGDLVETPDGWWIVFLGFRPQGGQFEHLGRETFLAPVTWTNGWPVINGGKPILATLPAPNLPPHPWPPEPARDEFDSTNLSLKWVFVRNPVEQNYSLSERPGWLRLHGSAVTLNDEDTPTFVGRRQTDLNCVASTKVDFSPAQTNEEAGLTLRGNERNHFDIVVTRRDGQRVVGLRKILDGQLSEPLSFQEIPAGEVILSVKAAPLSYEFFYTAANGRETSLGAARTRDLSTETLTGQKGAHFNFTGVVIGLFATGNGSAAGVPADFDWFEYSAGVPAAALAPPPNAIRNNQAATEKDHQNLMDQLGIKEIRRGRDGSNTNSPFYANYDEAKANPFPKLPEALTLKDGRKVTSPEMWPLRRAEITEDFDREIYGRVPAHTPKVNWEVISTKAETNGSVPVITKKLIGRVDDSADTNIAVNIDLTLTTPADAAGPVPVMMQFGFNFPAGFFGRNRGTNNFPPGGNGPTWQQQVLAKGWGCAVIYPYTVQADNGAGLTSGIIGLMNQGQSRKPDDWGALRAWAWGASRALDYFETDPAVDAKQVGIEGHSRFGKATLVTMAYDPRFAIAYVSSSGEGGAKLHRRDWGEVVENLAGSGEYHWMAGNFIKYAGPLNWGDLPVDSHELIALCAPRPVFISAGATQGDGWVDAKGSFLAAAAAGPVYTLLGKKDLGTTNFPPIGTALMDGDIAFRQHTSGHTDAPNWPVFLKFADRYIKVAPTAAK
jgi:beta-xylosidase